MKKTNKVEEIIARYGISKARLAAICGVTEATIHNWQKQDHPRERILAILNNADQTLKSDYGSPSTTTLTVLDRISALELDNKRLHAKIDTLSALLERRR